MKTPANIELIGLEVFAQGLLVDTQPAADVLFGLTDAVRLRIGP